MRTDGTIHWSTLKKICCGKFIWGLLVCLIMYIGLSVDVHAEDVHILEAITSWLYVIDVMTFPHPLSLFCVQTISLILFEVIIPNLVCGYILGWKNIWYHFKSL